jgi:adenine deaminase
MNMSVNKARNDHADIAITGGVIVGLGEYEGEEVIDAEGQMIVPGFIES